MASARLPSPRATRALAPLAAAAGIGAAGCAGPPPPRPVLVPFRHAAADLHFLVVGDAGAIERHVQPHVGRAMAEVCRASPCDLVLYLGDNFYRSGLPEDPDALERMFAERFLGPYCGVHAPFFAIVGNHDYGDGGSAFGTLGASPGTEVALRQVGLGAPGALAPDDWDACVTGWTGAGPPRWCMPSLDYAIEVPGVAGFVGVDTTPLIFRGAHALGPSRAYVADALRRFEGLPWRFVFAHHPLRSSGAFHGDAGDYPMYEGDRGGDVKRLHHATTCRGADVLFAGHDHHLEIRPEVPDCGAANIVSGAGGKVNPLEPDARDRVGRRGRAVATPGFFELRVRAGRLEVTMHEVPPGLAPLRSTWCATKRRAGERAVWTEGACPSSSASAGTSDATSGGAPAARGAAEAAPLASGEASR